MYDIPYTVFPSTVRISLKGKYFFLGFCAKTIYMNGFAQDAEHLTSLLTGYILLKEHADLFLVIFIEKVRIVPASGTGCLKKGCPERLG